MTICPLSDPLSSKVFILKVCMKVIIEITANTAAKAPKKFSCLSRKQIRRGIHFQFRRYRLHNPKVKIVGIILTITYIYIAVVKNVFDKFAVNYAALICIFDFKLVYIGSIRSPAFGKISYSDLLSPTTLANVLTYLLQSSELSEFP